LFFFVRGIFTPNRRSIFTISELVGISLLVSHRVNRVTAMPNLFTKVWGVLPLLACSINFPRFGVTSIFTS